MVRIVSLEYSVPAEAGKTHIEQMLELVDDDDALDKYTHHTL